MSISPSLAEVGKQTLREDRAPLNTEKGFDAISITSHSTLNAGCGSGGEIAEKHSDKHNTLELPCLDCGSRFRSKSKLNKHRNTHSKPFRCSKPTCYARFSQQQGLDRHLGTQHGDTAISRTVYHCTTDSCKYSSSGSRKKSFARLDQLKEHIKDYGHYGPHSPNDRKKRPGDPLSSRPFTEQVISFLVEEWNPDTISKSYLPSIYTLDFDLSKTNVWHADETGELYQRVRSDLAGFGFECKHGKGCYYSSHSPTPSGYPRTIFKKFEDCKEHERRSHSGSRSTLNFMSERKDSVSSLDSSRMSVFSSLDMSSSFHTQQSELQPVPHDASIWSMTPENTMDELLQIPSPVCNLSYDAYSPIAFQSSPLSINDFPDEPDHSNFFLGTPSLTDTSLSYPSELSVDWFPTNSMARGPPRPESTNSLVSRITCSFPGCDTTFARKYEMIRHLESVHERSTTYTCKKCSRSFNRKDKGREHIAKVHDISEDQERYLLAGEPQVATGVEPMSLLNGDRGAEEMDVSGADNLVMPDDRGSVMLHQKFSQ